MPSIESETVAADHVCHSSFQGSALKICYENIHCQTKNCNLAKILMGRIASQNMNALVMFKIGARFCKLKSKNKNLSGKGKLTDSLLTDCKTIMGLLFVNEMSSKMLLRLCFIAHQVSRKLAWAVSHRKKIVTASTVLWQKAKRKI
ncbi:hypothetical protein TNCV_3840391 [Trichonephila clavipes]|nr:hypothetical protein TNCV_3840391 [Trichonephila clavipes]